MHAGTDFKYQKLFSSLISTVMFTYLMAISLNLGVFIVLIVENQNSARELAATLGMVVGCLIQLLLFYWHCNEVSYESLRLSYAVFESDWPGTDLDLQQDVLLLATTTSERLVFKSGPFTEITLAVFVTILQESHSFYTLLKRTTRNLGAAHLLINHHHQR